MRHLLVLLLLFPFLNCSPPKYATQYFRAEDFSTSSIRGNAVGVAFTGLGEVSGYEKGFGKVYGKKTDFVKALDEAVVNKFRQLGINADPTSLENGQRAIIAKEINSFKIDWEVVPDELRELVVETCTREERDYLFVVTRWNISGKWESRSGHAMTTGPNGSTMTPTSHNSKMCYVTLQGVIMDKSGRILYYGQATGESEVFMFGFKSALKAGVGDAVAKFSQLFSGLVPEENISM